MLDMPIPEFVQILTEQETHPFATQAYCAMGKKVRFSTSAPFARVEQGYLNSWICTFQAASLLTSR